MSSARQDPDVRAAAQELAAVELLLSRAMERETPPDREGRLRLAGELLELSEEREAARARLHARLHEHWSPGGSASGSA